MLNRLVSSVTQQCWHVKGVHRIARTSRFLHLKLGGKPIALAEQTDGSRLKVDLRSHTEWHAFYSGKYDALWVDICSVCLHDSETFLDVGANIGMFSVKVALRNKDNKTVSFEPLPANVLRLKENIALNNVQDIVHVCDFGLSNQASQVDLVLRADFVAGSETGNASIAISHEADGDYETTPIHIKRLDDIAPQLGLKNIGVIKVDIEGHEDSFFQGGQQTIFSNRPIIIVEVNRACYEWKNEDAETMLLKHIPKDYKIMRSANKKNLIPCEDFNDIQMLENIVLYPEEKLARLQAFLS